MAQVVMNQVGMAQHVGRAIKKKMAPNEPHGSSDMLRQTGAETLQAIEREIADTTKEIQSIKDEAAVLRNR